MSGGSPDAVHKSSTSWACVGRLSEIKKRLMTSQHMLQTWQGSEEALNAAMNKAKEMNIDDKSLQQQLIESVKKDLVETKKKIGIERIKNGADNRMMEDLGPLQKRLNNGFWSRQCKLSLLIIEAGRYLPEALKNKRPNTCCDEKYEYYNYMKGEVTADLFGQSFMEYLEVLEH